MGEYNILDESFECPVCGTSSPVREIQFKYGPCRGWHYKIGEQIIWTRTGMAYSIRDDRAKHIVAGGGKCRNCRINLWHLVITIQRNVVRSLYVFPKFYYEVSERWSVGAAISPTSLMLLIAQYGSAPVQETLFEFEKNASSWQMLDGDEGPFAARLAAKTRGTTGSPKPNLLASKVRCPVCGLSHEVTLGFKYGICDGQRYSVGDPIEWKGSGPIVGIRDDRVKYIATRAEGACGGPIEVVLVIEENRVESVFVFPGFYYEFLKRNLIVLKQADRPNLMLLIEEYGAEAVQDALLECQREVEQGHTRILSDISEDGGTLATKLCHEFPPSGTKSERPG